MTVPVILAGSWLVAWLVTGALVRILRARHVVDVPNERSCHAAPTPRGGGLGLIAGLAAGLVLAWCLDGSAPRWSLLIGAAMIAACGWLDDLKRLPVACRLLAQAGSAAVLLAGTGPLERIPLPAPLDLPLGPCAVPVSLLWVVAVVNIYNFLDGIDGLAALQALLAGLAVACIDFEPGSRVVGLALTGAATGFLLHNWHPARIFLGDVGSTTIGFLLAGLPLTADRAAQPTAVFAVALSTWFFLADGTFTLLRRLLRGKRIWEAHREHLYQQLVLAGVPHDVVAGRVGAMAAAVCGAAVLAARAAAPALFWAALALAIAGFVLYLSWTWHCLKRV